MLTPYPLFWPETRERTASLRRAKVPQEIFGITYGYYCIEIRNELKRWHAAEVMISSNQKANNVPFTDKDPGVAVWWAMEDGYFFVLACDRYLTPPANLAVVLQSLTYLRTMHVAGALSWSQISQMLKTRYRLKPQPRPTSTARRWWEVLGVPMTANQQQVKAAYRVKARQTHPDHGGSADAFREVKAAYDEGLKQTTF